MIKVILELCEALWTTQGVMTPVMNQGQHDTCWSFSTTGTGNPVSFNEQQFVGCDIFDTGCNAGPIDYVTFAEKIARYTEGSYPGHSASLQLVGFQVGIFQGGVVGFTHVVTDNVRVF